jgi:hypothetical protein
VGSGYVLQVRLAGVAGRLVGSRRQEELGLRVFGLRGLESDDVWGMLIIVKQEMIIVLGRNYSTKCLAHSRHREVALTTHLSQVT